VLPQGGNVFEKAGVNVSVVYGSMPPEAYRAATGTDAAAAGTVRNAILRWCRAGGMQALKVVL
jgi:coproporphyrinogen III oxidase